MKCSSNPNPSISNAVAWILPLSLSLLLSSCGSPRNQTVGLPPLPPAGSVNSYVGQPGNAQFNSPLWNITIDHTKNQYSYNSITDNSVSAAGTFSPLTGDFLVLLGSNGYQNGLALELAGDAILLRPGDSTTPLVFAVQQASCFAISGYVKFLFDMAPGLTSIDGAAYGRIYGTTTADGASWQFDNFSEYQAPDGKDVPSDAINPAYVSGFPGNCTSSSGSAAVTSSPLAYFTNGSTSNIPTQYVVSPSGLLFANQNYTSVPPSTGWTYPQVSAWGLSEYSQSLPAGTVGVVKYVGFLLEVNNSSSIFRTRLVGFGNAPMSGTTMTGGTFPNEDPTQALTLNMSVTFGSQDPLNNGVFYLAKLSVPFDNMASCGSPLPNQNGILSCTYNAVALAGRPSGSYALFLTAFDANGNQKVLVLFQQ